VIIVLIPIAGVPGICGVASYGFVTAAYSRSDHSVLAVSIPQSHSTNSG